MSYSIGIDIGGTNTDAVLVDREKRIIASTKTPTTLSLEKGVETVLKKMQQYCRSSDVEGIFVGTTHATNAILERKDLYRVGVIRIAGHSSDFLRPCFSWPKELREEILVGYETIGGGFECDGREITPFSLQQAKEAVERLLDKGAESFAIVGVFSPLSGEQEIVCRSVISGFPVTLSHEIGGVGYIERENATILNAALKKPLEKGFRYLEDVSNQLGMKCPLYVIQNNGSLISLQQAIEYPLLTISAGPTNSFIGACRLENVEDAIVVDIGGTSTDIGLVRNGFPQRSISSAKIGEISLNFPIPDVLALALGGGSYITHRQGEPFIEPRSAGAKLCVEGQLFGGTHLTMTDIAAKAGCLSICEGNLSCIQASDSLVNAIMKKCDLMIQEGIQIMRGQQEELPVIVVGGGARIASYKKRKVIIPENAAVANAYGAVLAEITATIECVVSLKDRESTLGELQQKVIYEALNKGAKNPRIVDLKIIPYHYMPNQLAKVIVTASGKRFFLG